MLHASATQYTTIFTISLIKENFLVTMFDEAGIDKTVGRRFIINVK